LQIQRPTSDQGAPMNDVDSDCTSREAGLRAGYAAEEFELFVEAVEDALRIYARRLEARRR
jgi:hypothetical protein